MELAYPNQSAQSKTQGGIPLSHSGHNAGTILRRKNGAHRTTNVKNTTPKTLVAFCSKRSILPWREEFLEITLDVLEWCGLGVAR